MNNVTELKQKTRVKDLVGQWAFRTEPRSIPEDEPQGVFSVAFDANFYNCDVFIIDADENSFVYRTQKGDLGSGLIEKYDDGKWSKSLLAEYRENELLKLQRQEWLVNSAWLLLASAALLGCIHIFKAITA